MQVGLCNHYRNQNQIEQEFIGNFLSIFVRYNLYRMRNATRFFEEEEFDTLLLEVEQKQLILFNDDVNTFDNVIRWLVEICDHETVQAEQCAYLVHYTGKCSIKTGTWEELKPRASALLDRGLSVEIQ